MLILAGVSIAALTEENGILAQAELAMANTQRANVLEQAKLDILEWQTEQMKNNQSAQLTDAKVKEILTGKDYIKDGTPGKTSFTTKEGEHIITYSELYQIELPEIIFEPATLEIGAPVQETIAKYGQIVNGYDVKTDEFTSGVWKLFYQDSSYTYLITDDCVGSYNLISHYQNAKDENGEAKYGNGSSVGIIGQRLNKMLLDKGTFFTEKNKAANIRATAWLTDTEVWKDYKNEDALFAIASPTIELYKASFDATASINNATEFELTAGIIGYDTFPNDGQIKISYRYGIYNKDESSKWWIASPDGFASSGMLIASGEIENLSASIVNGGEIPVRPIVCIPTVIFDIKYASTLVEPES